MTDGRPFSDILDDAAEGLERAVVDTWGPYMHTLDAEAVESMWNPWTISKQNLPLLAYAMGVNLYEDIWTEDQKREWIDKNWTFLAYRGTLRGIEMALGASGYEVQDVVRPPQAFWASPDMSKAERDAWLRQMPELRITYRQLQEPAGPWLFDGEFEDDCFVSADNGPELLGRYAFLRQNGIDTPLDTIRDFSILGPAGEVTGLQAYATRGKAANSFYEGDFAGHMFASSDVVTSRMFMFRLEPGYDHVSSKLPLDVLPTQYTPQTVRFELDTEVGEAGPWFYAGDGFTNHEFVGEDDADLMLAQRLYLNDPNVMLQAGKGLSFANVDRIGIDYKTAELLINLNQKAVNVASFVNEAFIGDFYAVPRDDSHVDRAIRAVEASRGLLDRVYVRFDHMRPLMFKDEPEAGDIIESWVRETL